MPRKLFGPFAGKAGVSKEIRDGIQNHALQDVSSKSYDRWSYMPEKRAGMEQWNTFVTALLGKKPMTIAAWWWAVAACQSAYALPRASPSR